VQQLGALLAELAADLTALGFGLVSLARIAVLLPAHYGKHECSD
jgi:hypothetical protein